MSLATVFQSFSSAEAQLVRSRLEAAGFQATVTHELASLFLEGYTMASGGILVQVPEDQLAEAKEFLEDPSADDE